MPTELSNPFGATSYLGSAELYQILRDEILSLKIKPGELVSENTISNRFGVSRTPVRSCFERLRQDGFLEVIPKKGSFAALIDLDVAEQIIYMRIQVEVSAMCYISEHPDMLLFERLHRYLDEQKDLVSAGANDKAFYKLDSRFHEQCLIAIDKDKLWQIIQDMDVHYSRYRRLDYLATRRFTALYHEHCHLLELMENGRTDELRLAIYKHLYGGFLNIGHRFVTEYSDYFKDSARNIDEILLFIKKQISENSLPRK